VSGTAGIDLGAAHLGSPEVEVPAAIVEAPAATVEEEHHRLRTKGKEAVADNPEEGQNTDRSLVGS